MRPGARLRESAKPRSAKPPVARIELHGIARLERTLVPAKRVLRAVRRLPVIAGMIAGIIAAILAIALAPGHFAIEKVDDNISAH
jgi:hypothetical protein